MLTHPQRLKLKIAKRAVARLAAGESLTRRELFDDPGLPSLKHGAAWEYSLLDALRKLELVTMKEVGSVTMKEVGSGPRRKVTRYFAADETRSRELLADLAAKPEHLKAIMWPGSRAAALRDGPVASLAATGAGHEEQAPELDPAEEPEASIDEVRSDLQQLDASVAQVPVDERIEAILRLSMAAIENLIWIRERIQKLEADMRKTKELAEEAAPVWQQLK